MFSGGAPQAWGDTHGCSHLLSSCVWLYIPVLSRAGQAGRHACCHAAHAQCPGQPVQARTPQAASVMLSWSKLDM